MASGTKIRALTRLLDTSDAPVWAIDPAGKLIYLSAATAEWLGLDVEQLIHRRAIAGVPESDDPLDRVAASLAPPHGLSERGTARLVVQPPSIENQPVEAADVRFVRIGGEGSFTLAVAGEFDDREIDQELDDDAAVRRCLDAWRRQHAQLAAVATAGASAAARRLRNRIQVAASTRTHVGFFGPRGCGGESIAVRVHQSSAAGEPMAAVDGSLMDPELLDATMVPLINQLADSEKTRATALVRGLDEMPPDAQQRLADLLTTYPSRLRLLALCSRRPRVLADPIDGGDLTDGANDVDTAANGFDEGADEGIILPLIDFLSSLTVTVPSLASRVEDIPVIAAALADTRHAAGEGSGERLSRAALDALVLYPWPGNFEELDQAIRHAVRTAPRASIGVEHLPLAIRSFRVGSPPPSASAAKSLDDAVRRYELRLIEAAVEAAGGNRAEAARQLGISRARLIRRLEETAEK